VAFVATVAFYNVLRRKRRWSSRGEPPAAGVALPAGVRLLTRRRRAKIDVVRAEANLYDAARPAEQAENGLRVARITLLQRIGVDGPAGFRLSGVLSPSNRFPGTLQDWVAEAERNRPELRALVEKERAASESLRLARRGTSRSSWEPPGTLRGGGGPPPAELRARRHAELPALHGVPKPEQTKEALATISSTQYEFIETKRRVRLRWKCPRTASRKRRSGFRREKNSGRLGGESPPRTAGTRSARGTSSR